MKYVVVRDVYGNCDVEERGSMKRRAVHVGEGFSPTMIPVNFVNSY